MLTQKNLKIEIDGIIEDIQTFFKKNGAKGAIVGNSGGKDSATVIALLVKALGKENVLTVTLPCNSKNQDREDAILVANTFGVKCINVSLDETYLTLKKNIEKGIQKNLSEDALINMKPRLRMTTLRAIAQTQSYFLVGTGNRCEIFIGYFTKDGDGSCDYNPLAEFTVEEIYQIARYLGVPEKILKKAPSDGLSGKTDEEKIGVPYADVSEYIITGTTNPNSIAIILNMHNNSNHKRNMPRIYHRLTSSYF